MIKLFFLLRLHCHCIRQGNFFNRSINHKSSFLFCFFFFEISAPFNRLFNNKTFKANIWFFLFWIILKAIEKMKERGNHQRRRVNACSVFIASNGLKTFIDTFQNVQHTNHVNHHDKKHHCVWLNTINILILRGNNAIGKTVHKKKCYVSRCWSFDFAVEVCLNANRHKRNA